MIGRVVGNYEIVERLGEGGMGTVWRAVDVMLERSVAIKAIRADLAAEPQIVERFRSEAKILARVHHPAIATIYSFFRDGGELYLAMEFVRGRSLARVLVEEGALAWPRAVALTVGALEGIEQVHRTGIIHRDLKPDNLMLTEAGDIKVMDFGIARVANTHHLTRTGFMVGTLRYMSPEQLRGESVDHRADLYSLGVCLYEMLTGRVPFPGGSEYEAIRALVEDPPVPPGTIVPGIPAWLDRVVLTALAKTPEERFPSAAAMAESLGEAGPRATAVLDDLPTLFLRERPRRREVPAASSAAPSGSPATGAPRAPALAALPLNPPPPATGASSYQAVGLGRSRGLLLGLAAAVLFFAVAFGVVVVLRGRSAADAPASPADPTSPTPAATSTATTVPSTPPPPAAESVPGKALPTTNPALPPLQSDLHARRTPPVPSPGDSAGDAGEKPAAPVASTPAASPAPATEAPIGLPPTGGSGPGEAAMAQLSQFGDQLDAAAGRLADAASDFSGRKKDRNEALTEADDKLKDEIDALRAATTRFNRRVNASALRRVTWRLRREGDAQRRVEVVARVREIDETLERIQRLLGQTRADAPVLAVWQEVRRVGRQINQACQRS
jgi:serine/threonine-protein kinase